MSSTTSTTTSTTTTAAPKTKATDPDNPFVAVISPEKTGDPALDQATGADQLPNKEDAQVDNRPGINPNPFPKLDVDKASLRDAVVTLAYIVRNNLGGDNPYARDKIDLLLEALGVDEKETQAIHEAINDRSAKSIERLAKRDKEDQAFGVR